MLPNALYHLIEDWHLPGCELILIQFQFTLRLLCVHYFISKIVTGPNKPEESKGSSFLN